jgi:hypothetical protein
MVRESLGTVRLHRWTCDQDQTVVENRSRATGTIPMPDGWSRIKVQVDNILTEGDVCSPKCAAAFMRDAQALLNNDEAKAEGGEA